MNPLIYLLLFNIFAVPFIIYTQIQGVCDFIISLVGNGGEVLCQYTENPFLNLLYLNIIFVVIAFVIYGMNQTPKPPPHKPAAHH